jgi:hypothetical protein
MATRTTTATDSGSPTIGLRVGLVQVTATYSYGAGLSASEGDVIQMVNVPKGAQVVYLALSGGSGDMLAACGDGVSTTRYLASTTMGSALPTVRTITLHASNTPYVYSTDDTIDVTIGTVSVATITGGFHITAIYAMNA